MNVVCFNIRKCILAHFFYTGLKMSPLFNSVPVLIKCLVGISDLNHTKSSAQIIIIAVSFV